MRFRSWGLGVACLVLLAAFAANAQAKRLAGLVPDVGAHGARISRVVQQDGPYQPESRQGRQICPTAAARCFTPTGRT